ncbi:hypothetical protein QE152_g26240 [Popillia japonica]|uniref:Uncharacterized protein n=1 Tax=Popillia japonica TaxID=7064 RepID=A0AAW1K001_POPJA
MNSFVDAVFDDKDANAQEHIGFILSTKGAMKQEFLPRFIKNFDAMTISFSDTLECQWPHLMSSSRSFRMSMASFDELLEKIKNIIQLEDTNMRNCIKPELRLAATLK